MRKQTAFTLIELLVVIAIIGVLTMLMLPGIAKSKEKAKQLKCLANLKQHGQAAIIYFDENNENLPWRASASLYAGKAGALPAFQFGADSSIRWLNLYLVGGSLEPDSEVESAQCPSDKGFSSVYKSNNVYEDFGNSYIVNHHDPEQKQTLNDGDGQFRISAVRRPSRTILFADNSVYNYNEYDSRKQYWHTSEEPIKANICFVDGSAKYLRIVKPGTCSSYPNSADYQWSPN
jgi:prepilin-type N-terminal cleavage/methylation domain-containing protein/prepilin-type processing-associated H-X9-DG protein